MLSNLKIYQRLTLAVIFPILLLIGLASYDLLGKWNVRQEMTQLAPLSKGVALVSRLIHELQRERGGSAVFIGSKGAEMRNELPGLRQRTDGIRNNAIAAMATLAEGASSDFKEAIDIATKAVAELDARRKEIDALAIPAPASSAFFTNTIAKLLVVSGEIARAASQSYVAVAVASYVNFIEGKERAGQERAQAAGSVALGRFDMGVFSKVLGVVAAQEVYFKSFLSSATPEQSAFYNKTMSGPVVERVVKMRQTIVEGGLSGDMKGLTGKDWFDATTARIDAFKIVEDRLTADLEALTSAKEKDATWALTILAVLIAVVLVVSFVVVLVMARSITTPFGALLGVMKELADGRTAVDVRGTGRQDEIGAMARTVSFFKDNIIKANDLTAKEAEAVKQSAARAMRISDLTGQFDADIASMLASMSEASSQLQSTAASMSTTAEETSQQAATVAAATEEASSNVQTVAVATEELSSSVSEIGRQVTQSARIAQKAVEEAERTNQTVQSLASAAEKIGDVVKLINEIAGQTNLLALNATIEAARAGEAGRGFAVVAAEVKSLAEQTAKATGDIGAQIAAIQSSSGEAVKAIQTIGGTIGEINEIASSIAGAVEEQNAATQEIARNVQHAAQGANEISSNISGVTTAAGHAGTAASQVLAASQELSKQSDLMRRQVEGFISSIKAA